MNGTLSAMSSQPPVGSRDPGAGPEAPAFFPTEAAADAAMTYFYGRLFASNPEIWAMFPATMTAQRRQLYAALCRIAAAGHDDTELESYLEALGRAHRKFGVRPEHHTAFREALEATFRRYPPDEEQWTEPERA